MRIFSFFLFAILPLLGNAQARFVIDGRLDAPDNTMLHLVYPGPEAWQVDSVKLLQGKFRFTGGYTEPVKASISMRVGSGGYRSVSFYLENIPVKISAGKDLSTATVKGGTINREWDAWEKMNVPEREEPDSGLIASYVSRYPGSVVSLDLIVEKLKTEKYYSLFEQLAPELKTLPRAQEYDQFVKGHRALKVGQIAPDFTALDPDGRPWKLSDYRGKYVYLDFWASWCKPCRAAHPWLKKINDRFKDKDFVMLGISLDFKKEAWLKAIAEDHVPWKQGSELNGFKGEIPKLYQIGILPNGVLIGPDGRIMEKGNLENTLEERLAGARKKFMIEGSIGLPDSTTISLITPGNKPVVIQKTKVKDGRFYLSGSCQEPMMANLLVFFKGDMSSRTIYLEDGVIRINAGKNLSEAIVTAGPLNKEWDAWQRKHGPELTKQAIADLTGYIEQHPGSPLSLDLILYNWERRQSLYPLLKTLDVSLQKTDRAKKYSQIVEAELALNPGGLAPDFTVQDPGGNSWKLSDFRGKYVLLDFWASWCKPCRAAIPELMEIYNKYKDKGFTILGISIDKNAKNWIDAVETDNVPWKQGSDLQGENGEVARLYRISYVPQLYLLDPEGRIIGRNDFEKVLADRLGH